MSNISLPQSVEKSIVLVEDDEMIAEIVTEVLTEEGYTVIGPFITREAASLYLDSHECALVILDYNVKDGITVNLFKDLALRGVACILCSGCGGVNNWGDIPDNSRYLSKPFRLDGLITLVGEVYNC